MEPFHRHLHSQEYYKELYDKQTIKQCLWFYEIEEQLVNAKDLPKDVSNIPLKKRRIEIARFINFQVTCFKGRRWEKKKETINKWMRRDKDRDDKMEHKWETAKPKLNRTCEKCSGRQHKLLDKWFSHKDVLEDDLSQSILFFYECSKCKHRSGEYDDGEIYDFNSYCPECNTVLKKKRLEYKNKIVFRSTCSRCSYTSDYEMSLNTKKKKKTKADLKKEQNERDAFEINRREFCLSDKLGEEYLDSKRKFEELGKIFAEIEHKEKNKELYEKVAKVERINIFEAQKRMTKVFKGKKFTKLKFGDPNIRIDVTCDFRIYEMDANRSEKDACKDLEKLINKAFDNTNWKLMAKGITYRMGILEGGIRGMEKEKDILKNITL